VRVVVVGAGKVGTFIASDLLRAGHDVVVVEQQPSQVEHLREREALVGVEWVAGDACEVSTLSSARCEGVDVLVAVTGDDEDNLVVSLLAKQEFAVPRVLARVNHPENEWLFTEQWGVDVAVSTPHLITALVEEAVSVGSLVRLLQFAGGRARLVEVTLAEGAPVIGHDLASARLPRDSSIVAVIRSGDVVVPRGDTVFYEGDEVIALVTDDSEATLRALLIAPATGGPPQASSV
jgi:trk system potassium uptake protein TrkA